jgi:para-nitrobenzyl esterase
MEAFRMQMEKQFGGFETEFETIYGLKSPDDMKRILIESARDRERVSMFLWASRRGKNHHQPVFTYYFDRAIPWPQHPEFGAFHSGELPYFFGNLDKLDRPWEELDRDLAKTTQSYLKHFATAGNPNGTGLAKWDRVRADAPSTMEVGARIGPMPLADRNRLDFWTRFFESPQAKHAPLF